MGTLFVELFNVSLLYHYCSSSLANYNYKKKRMSIIHLEHLAPPVAKKLIPRSLPPYHHIIIIIIIEQLVIMLIKNCVSAAFSVFHDF